MYTVQSTYMEIESFEKSDEQKETEWESNEACEH